MSQVVLRITAVDVPILAGDLLPTTIWTAGIDHAALVSARRSRADGYDIVMGSGVRVYSATGLATNNLRLSFPCPVGIADTEFADVVMDIGNLGASTNPFQTPTGTTLAGTATVTATLQSLVLPVPGFPFSLSTAETATRTTGELVRAARRVREVAPHVLRVEWPVLHGSRYWDILAMIDTYGRSGTVSPSWAPGGPYRMQDWQFSRRGVGVWSGSMTLEEMEA